MKPATDFASAFVIVAVTMGGAFAQNAVNCDDVMRSLKRGASPRDLADTTSISIDKIEECQHKADVQSLDLKREKDESDERRKPLRPDSEEGDSCVTMARPLPHSSSSILTGPLFRACPQSRLRPECREYDLRA